MLDMVGAAAVAALGCAAVVAQLTAGYVYQWLLPLVSVLSLVAVLVSVHPAAKGFRRIMGWFPLVEVGKRSYGLYLWSWPIFVIVGATDGAIGSFVVAMLITVVVAEASYRWLETPVRQGVVGRWWKDRATVTYAPIAGGALLIGCLVLFYASVGQFSFFEGGDDAVFVLAEPATTPDPQPASATTIVDEESATTAPAATTTSTTVAPPELTRLAIVGDSQANALAVNLPEGIEEAFSEVINGSLDGCSVYDSGQVRSSVSFNNDFAECEGWQDDWADSALQSDVALVVVGAWDVFDVEDGSTTYVFDTAEGDLHFAANLISGIDAMLAEGTSVALLEVACMRPENVAEAGVRALPERGDDSRVAHLNELLRWVSSQYGPEVRVVDGPDEWCNNEAIATDLSYRWDGVHVYQPGANLIYTKIAPDLLSLAAK
ncbi:MAG: acyltransferase [Actinobacteria bacterium]|nr:acyltransferase [Actinomycetota bacterium]